MDVIGHLTMPVIVVHKIIIIVNIIFTKMISWPTRTKMDEAMVSLKLWCGIPSIHGTIYRTHNNFKILMSICKRLYFWNKKRRIFSHCSSYCYHKNRFIYAGAMGSMHDVWVLHKFSFYRQPQYYDLFNPHKDWKYCNMPPHLLRTSVSTIYCLVFQLSIIINRPF